MTNISSPQQLAQASPGSPLEIGHVQSVAGDVYATHADGSRSALAEHAPVYQLDQIETSADGALEIEFVDHTSFSIGSDAKMVLDELVYSPSSHSGSAVFSAVKGTFIFISGEVAASGPDAMRVKTPAGVLGIRGTTVGCAVHSGDAATTCALLPSPDGSKGHQVAFSNFTETVLLNDSYDSVVSGGPRSFMSKLVLSDSDAQNLFGGAITGETGYLLQLFTNPQAGPDQGGGTQNEGHIFSPFDPGSLGNGLRGSGLLGPTDGGGHGPNFPDPPRFLLGEQPSASPDGNVIVEDAAPNLVLGNVLANDLGSGTLAITAVNGSAAAIGMVVHGAFGDVIIASNGSYIYALNNANPTVNNLENGQTLTDTFTYTAVDGAGQSLASTLTITIDGHGAPLAEPDGGQTAVVIEDVILSASGNVLTNEANTDPGSVVSLHVSAVGTASFDPSAGTFSAIGTYGSVVIHSDGSYVYTLDNSSLIVQQLAAGQSVTDVFTYTADDLAGNTSSTTLTITVIGTDDVPVVNPGGGGGGEGGGGGGLTGSVTEDSQPEGTSLITASNTIAFTDVDITDAHTVSSAFVSSTNPNGGAELGTLNASLTHDTTGTGTGGVVTWTYTVNDDAIDFLAAGQTVVEEFTVSISDSHGGTTSENVFVTITGVNEAPIANPDVASAQEDTTLTATGNVITTGPGIDTDVDVTDTLTVTAVAGAGAGTVGGTTAGTYGVLTLNSNGSYTYSLNNGTNGTASLVQNLAAGATVTDTFSYTISDGHGGTSSTTLTITVTGTNDAPVAHADVNSVTEDTSTSASGNVITTGAGIDTDIDVTPVPDTLTVTAVSGTGAGTVGGTTAGTYGSLTLNSNGSYTYNLNNGTNGTASLVQNLAAGATVADTFHYTISDGHGGTSSSTLTITVTGTNDAPVAHADVNSVTEDVTLTATGNVITTAPGADTDIDVTPVPDTLTVTAVSGTGAGTVGGTTAGTYGSLTLNSNGSYTYTLNNGSSLVQQLGQGQTVADTFSYTISDGHGGTSSTTLTITVTGTADVVGANPDVNSVTEDTTLSASGNVITTPPGVDTDSDPTAVLTVTAVSGTGAGTVGGTTAGTYGSLTLNSDGSYTYTLNNGTNGTAGLVQNLAAGATVADTFHYTISDGHGGTSSTTLTITVTGTNDAPVAHADVNSVTEDTSTSASGNVITTGAGIDTDIDVTPTPDTLTVTAVSGTGAGTVGGSTAGTYGSLTLNSNGSYTYNLNNGTNGTANLVQNLAAGATVTDTFHYTISDGHGGTSSTTLTITVTGTNDAPVAHADVNSVTEDVTLTATGNVITTAPGADTDIDVTPVPDTLTVTAVSGTGAGTVGGTTAGTYGSLTLNSNGSYTYTLNNGSSLVQQLGQGQTVADTFSYTISDGHGGTSSTTLTITVTGTADVVGANPDVNSVTEDTTLSASGNVITTPPGVDTDSDPTAVLTVTAVSGTGAGTVGGSTAGTYGSLTLNSNGSYTYTLNNGTNGTAGLVQNLAAGATVADTFHYTISDGHGGTSSTTLTITVTGTNDAPVAHADVNSVTEDTSTSASGNVITTGAGIDTDIDVTPTPDTLTVTAVSGTGAGTVGGSTAGTYGSLTLNSNGSYTYNLNNGTNGTANLVQNLAAGATVTDTFHYTISDGHGGTSSTTLTITVTGTNDAPVAHADVNSVTEDVTLTATGNVITTAPGADTDIDVTPVPDTLTVTAVSGTGAGTVGGTTAGTYGSLTLNSNGSYTYTLNNGSSLVQQLGQGQTVADTFSYTISDGHGGTSSTTLTITVTGTADVVGANPDVNSVTEDTTLSASGNVITTPPGVDTDSDPTAVLTVTAVSGTGAGTVGGTTAGTYGSLTLNSDGSYTYTLNNGTNGTAGLVQNLAAGATVADTFHYTISDGHGGTSSTTLTITVTGTNDAPVAHADVNSVTEDTSTSASGNVITTGAGIDTDIDVTPTPDTLTVTAVSGTAAGTVNGTTAGTYGVLTLHTDGSYSYALNNGTNGTAGLVQNLAAGATVTDTFSYTISDGHGGTSSTTLTITVTGTNDAPVAHADVNSVTEDTTLSASGNVITTGAGIDTDIDVTPVADTLTVSAVTGGIVGGVTHGTYGDLTLNSNGSYSYSLNNGTNGVAGPVQSLAQGATVADVFTYTVSDGHGGTSSTTLTITVHGTDDAPVVTAGAVDTYTTGLTTTEVLTITPGLTVTDIDSTTLASATVSIQGFHAGDILGFTHQTGITESYNSITGVLTLSGIASLATYQTELESITFSTTSTDSSDRTIDYTANDGFLDSTLATSLIHIEPLLNIHGTLTTNSNSNDQTVLLTVTDEANPTHSFQTLIFLSLEGQQGTFADHANFSIGSGHNFLISVEWVSGSKVDVTDFTLDGVTIINQVQHASLGDGTGGSNDAIVAEINPFTSLVSGFTLSTDGGTGTDSITGTATPSAQYLYGGGGTGNDILTGLNGVHNILNGGAGGTDILTGGDSGDILVWNGGNTSGAALSTYAGGAGTDILRVDGTSQTIDLHALVTNNHISGIEVLDLTGASATTTSGGPTGSNTLTLSAADVLESGSNTITVLGDGNDTVNLTSGFTGATPTPLATDPTHFSVYQSTSGPAVTVIVANTLNDAPAVHIT